MVEIRYRSLLYTTFNRASNNNDSHNNNSHNNNSHNKYNRLSNCLGMPMGTRC